MKKQRSNYPVKMMARVLNVSRSGFYAWLKRPSSAREISDRGLKILILKAHNEGRGTYGTRRLQATLASWGFPVGRDHIGRLRKELGLQCKQRRKFKATTNSRHDLPVKPNLLEQDFNVAEPGTVYGTDITYIPTGEGWLYLAGVEDFCTREIIGYAMSERMTKALVHRALVRALRYRRPQKGCIHHSDRGVQYCAKSYQKAVEDAGMRGSMSRKGNCYDNAPAESFWGSLKQELIFHRRFATRAEAKAAIQEYIEVFYNRMRCHSSLGNMAPAIFSEKYHTERRSA